MTADIVRYLRNAAIVAESTTTTNAAFSLFFVVPKAAKSTAKP